MPKKSSWGKLFWSKLNARKTRLFASAAHSNPIDISNIHERSLAARLKIQNSVRDIGLAELSSESETGSRREPTEHRMKALVSGLITLHDPTIFQFKEYRFESAPFVRLKLL